MEEENTLKIEVPKEALEVAQANGWTGEEDDSDYQ